jgi:MFS-type transporter involved in bile tolerance (Atg22 family)
LIVNVHILLFLILNVTLICVNGITIIVNWFRSYLSNRQSHVRVSGIFYSPFEVVSGVPQGSVLGPLLFSVFINDLGDAITYSKYLLFADDIKIYQAIKSPVDCNLLQSDINSIQGWCTANCPKLNMSKTKIITSSRETNMLIYDYKLCQSSLARTDSIKDLGIFLDSKLQFHDHVNHVFSHCTSIKLLGLVRSITFTSSPLDCMHKLHIVLIRSKLEYASVVWNSITSTDASKLERIQRSFAALCFNRFFPTFITVIFLLWNS